MFGRRSDLYIYIYIYLMHGRVFTEGAAQPMVHHRCAKQHEADDASHIRPGAGEGSVLKGTESKDVCRKYIRLRGRVRLVPISMCYTCIVSFTWA